MSGSRVYVGHLSSRATERDVERFFRSYGRLRDVGKDLADLARMDVRSEDDVDAMGKLWLHVSSEPRAVSTNAGVELLSSCPRCKVLSERSPRRANAQRKANCELVIAHQC